MPGGSANDYDYVTADPINSLHLDGHIQRATDGGGIPEGMGVVRGGAPGKRKPFKWNVHFPRIFKHRKTAVKKARTDAKRGGLACEYRSACTANDHVHVDHYRILPSDKRGDLTGTVHYYYRGAYGGPSWE